MARASRKQPAACQCLANKLHLNNRRTSYHQVSVMRQLWLGLLVAMAIASCLLAVAQISYDSGEEKAGSQYNDINEQPAKVAHKFDLDRGISDSEIELLEQPSWYSSFMKPISSIFGFDQAAAGDQSDRLAKQGYLNYKRFQRAPNGSLARLFTGAEADVDAEQEPAPPPATAEHPREPRKSASVVSGRSQLVSALEPSATQVIQVDKIKGIDLPALLPVRQAKTSQAHDRRSKSSRAGQATNMVNPGGAYEYADNIKCLNNKHDRLIAQKLSLGEISKPVINSDGRFDNPFPTWQPGNLLGLVEFMLLESDESGVPNDRDELEKSLPSVRPNFHAGDPQNFRVTWIGHSTLLIQIDGFNILTDPIFSDRASPFQFVGPKRIREPACDVKSLPQIDIVLISHNHFDHLDSDSVIGLNSRFGEKTRWIVPLGVADFLKSNGVRNYVELDWWQKDCFHAGTNTSSAGSPPQARRFELASPHGSGQPSESGGSSRASRTSRLELDVYLTPAQHWSRRGINDFNKSLWGSYTIVSSNGSTFFFSGDTGYCSAFKEVSRVFGPLTGAAIPIGAYKPRWFLKSQHVDPEEAVQIHKDLRSMKSIAIHHSTFVLSKEHYKEPVELLAKFMANVTADEEVGPFLTLKHGESTEFRRSLKN